MIALFDQLAERMAGMIEERLRPVLTTVQAGPILESSQLNPLQVYSAKQVADWLGISRVESVYDIPDSELPRVRRIGKHFGYLGINVLCYMHDLPPVNMKKAIEGYKDRLMQERSKVLPMNPEKAGLTRVM